MKYALTVLILLASAARWTLLDFDPGHRAQLCRPLSQNPPHQGYGEKRQHIKDAVPGSALGLGEVPVA